MQRSQTMTKHEALLFEKLVRLVSFAQHLLDNGGRFSHAATEAEYQALLKEPARESVSAIGLELVAMHRGVASVVGAKVVDARMLAQLQATRDHASVLMLDDEYQPVRAPMKSGFTD